MMFKLSTVALTLFSAASLISAAPFYDDGTLSLERRAGPSGSVITPPGGTNYNSGDQIYLKYKIANQGSYAKTSSIAVNLVNTPSKVVYNPYNYTLASALAYAEGSDVIEAHLRVPFIQPKDFTGSAAGLTWVSQLEIIETQTGTLGAKPFRAAAPTVNIKNAN